MPTHYEAVISKQGDWTWIVNKPEDARTAPLGKQVPIFKRGDTLKLRLADAPGRLSMILSSVPPSDRPPFAYPYDLHSFDFDSEVTTLTCVGVEDEFTKCRWTFKIGKGGGTLVDPELQVGPEGVPPQGSK